MSKIISGKEYLGTVIENDDPNKAGRCKIRVMKIMDGFDDAHIPWATPGASTTFAGNGSGSLSIPKKGTVVRVKFNNGEIEAPEYYGVQKVDKDLINELKDDYIGSQVLCYDHENDMSVMYQPNHGIRIYLKGSKIEVLPSGMINLQHAGNTCTIQLDGQNITIASNNDVTSSANVNNNIQGKIVNIQGSEGVKIKGDHPGECAVNGMALMQMLEFMCTKIDTKYPATPGVTQIKLMTLKDSILNQKIQYT